MQVRAQWLDEIAAWQLDDPKIAMDWMWRPQAFRAPSRVWSGGRDGSMAELARWFGELPRGRLAILGGGGVGKTSLAVLLLRELAGGYAPGRPVPVLLSLAGYDPHAEPLQPWLVRRLRRDYRALRAPAYGPTAVEDLVAQRRILPVLDGLDEIPANRLAAVVQEVNRFTDADPLVVTCRSGGPHAAVQPGPRAGRGARRPNQAVRRRLPQRVHRHPVGDVRVRGPGRAPLDRPVRRLARHAVVPPRWTGWPAPGTCGWSRSPSPPAPRC
jgi:hypothetical protein